MQPYLKQETSNQIWTKEPELHLSQETINYIWNKEPATIIEPKNQQQ